MHHALPYRSAPLATVLLCVLAAGGAEAQDASPWDPAPHGAARLIAGTTHRSEDGTSLRAGIEIKLDPGWHTYWRYPGDSGVPPAFDFSGSENVKSVSVLWPAPRRLPDGAGGFAIGYVDHVVFPLRVIPTDEAMPATLHLKLGYAICRDLCLPAEADLKLTPTGKGGDEEPALAASEARVPRRVPLGAGTALAIRSVHREKGDGRERVIVEVAAPEAATVDLLVEGPTPDWALPLPQLTNAATNARSETRRFAFDLDGLPPGAHADGATLTFTAVSPDDAIEVVAPLD